MTVSIDDLVVGVSDLTQQVSQTLAAVNVQKSFLDNAVGGSSANSQAAAASAQVAQAAAQGAGSSEAAAGVSAADAAASKGVAQSAATAAATSAADAMAAATSAAASKTAAAGSATSADASAQSAGTSQAAATASAAAAHASEVDAAGSATAAAGSAAAAASSSAGLSDAVAAAATSATAAATSADAALGYRNQASAIALGDMVAALSASGGAALVKHGTETVASELDALQLADYTALRAYGGARKNVYVTAYGIAGMFVRDDADTTTADDDLNTIVAANHIRWKRRTDGATQISVEAFRIANDGSARSDSNTIRAALTYIGANLVGKMTVLRFDAGREYVYDRTASLDYINNLIIDLNGATLKRAPASATVTTLAQDAGTGQANIYMDSIPANWEVGDFLVGFNGPSFAATSPDPIRITAIDRVAKRVTLLSGLGSFGGYASIIPAGASVGKSFSAFAGRPSSTEAQSMLTPGVNENVHICNGIIDGNKVNQVNNSWRYCSEIFMQGKLSSVTNITFKDTTSECIIGHGLKVSGNRFLNLGGSCFHISVHDDTVAQNSMSWFVHNFVDGCNRATSAVNGHSEGAITFSWGAGRLVVSQNDFRNGSESVVGAFGPSTGAMPDKWLIFENNLCQNFAKLFYSITLPVEGVMVLNNILVNITSINAELSKLTGSNNSSVGGNLLIGSDEITAPYRASNAVFGPLDAGTIIQLKMVARNAAIAGFNYSRLTDNVAAIEGVSANIAFVTSEAGAGGFQWFSSSGTNAGSFFQQWIPSTKRLKFLNNIAGGAVEFATPLIAPQLSVCADNASAVAAGLAIGTLYKTATGEVRVVV